MAAGASRFQLSLYANDVWAASFTLYGIQGRKTRIGYYDLQTDILMLQEIELWRGIRAKVVVPLLQTECRSVQLRSWPLVFAGWGSWAWGLVSKILAASKFNSQTPTAESRSRSILNPAGRSKQQVGSPAQTSTMTLNPKP